MSEEKASDPYGKLAEYSLITSSRVAIVLGVGCNPPLSSLLSLPSSSSPLHCNLRHCLSPVSARRGPRTCLSTCSSLPSSLTSPSCSSVCCRRNAAMPPAWVLPSSAGWDAFLPPCPCCCCSHCAVNSDVAHPQYPPNVDPGHAVEVFVVGAVVDVALSPLCLPPVTGQQIRVGIRHVLLLPPHVIIIVSTATKTMTMAQ